MPLLMPLRQIGLGCERHRGECLYQNASTVHFCCSVPRSCTGMHAFGSSLRTIYGGPCGRVTFGFAIQTIYGGPCGRMTRSHSPRLVVCINAPNKINFGRLHFLCDFHEKNLIIRSQMVTMKRVQDLLLQLLMKWRKCTQTQSTQEYIS